MLPENVKNILQKGRKHSVEPPSTRHRMLAMVRRLGARVSDEERDRAIGNGVATLVRTVSKRPATRPPFGNIVAALRRNDLSVVQADKEGGFVVLSSGAFQQRAESAISKNFRQVDFNPKKTKARALRLLGDLNLDSVKKAANKAAIGVLEVFYTGKTHKPDCPFRVIVSGKGTWQVQVGRYLQRHLGRLPLNDPFLVRSSDDVVCALKSGRWDGVFGFSLDVEDLYYNIPHEGLFKVLRERIDAYGELKFNGETGANSAGFLELLEFYLQSTVIQFDERFFVQRSGICIGSELAPILSDLYLSSFDQRVSDRLCEKSDYTIMRYVDDFLVIVNGVAVEDAEGTVRKVVDLFRGSSDVLKFTWEVPVQNKMRFLDLELAFENSHVCWKYHPRASKQLIPFDCAHSKLIKRAVAMTCLRAALNRSCHHAVQSSFEGQFERLKQAGFPSFVLSGVCESLLQEVKHQRKKGRRAAKNRQEEGARHSLLASRVTRHKEGGAEIRCQCCF